MRKTFIYRAKVSNQVEKNCHQWLGICREIYNSALGQRINRHKKTKESISVYDPENPPALAVGSVKKQN